MSVKKYIPKASIIVDLLKLTVITYCAFILTVIACFEHQQYEISEAEKIMALLDEQIIEYKNFLDYAKSSTKESFK